jgi:hypothetical protein
MINPLQAIGAAFIGIGARSADQLLRRGGARQRLRRPVLLAPALAPDDRDRLLLAAGRRAHGDLHRHGAGAAEYTGFSRFEAESAVATIVVLSMVRELGPVLAGLMVGGRVGAAMAAELGTCA